MSVTNSFLYTDWLSMHGLRLLLNKLQVAQFFNTEYNKEFTKEFAVGSTVRIPFPWQAQVTNGLGYQPQAIERRSTTVTVDQIFGVHFEWDTVELALKMGRGEEAIKKDYLEPAMAALAQEIDSRAALWAYQNSNNIVGVLGTDPTSFTTFGQARQRMIELACPPSGEKGVIIPPSVNTSMVAAAIQYFNPADAISKQYKEGSIGRNNGFSWYESMSLYSHTAGTWAGTVSLNGAPADGATSIAINATAGDTFNKGDVFSIGSGGTAIYAVNPMTRRRTTTGTLKTFDITQALTATGGGSALDVLNLSQPLYLPGNTYQNVDAAPANGAALTLFPGTSSPNGKQGINGLALHEDAFALVGVAMERPKSSAAEISTQTRDPETGIAVRFVRMFDPIESKMVNRFDVLMGFGNLYNDSCSVRILAA